MRELGRTSPPDIACILGQKGIAKHPFIYLPFFFFFLFQVIIWISSYCIRNHLDKEIHYMCGAMT